MNLLDFFSEPMRRVAEESRAYLNSPQARRPDVKIIVTFLAAALCLTAQRYVAMGDQLKFVSATIQRCVAVGRDLPVVSEMIESHGWNNLGDEFDRFMWESENAQLNRLTWWCCVSLTTNVLVPMLLIRLVFRERLRDYGLKLGGVFADWWVYVLMMAVAAPVIVIASASREFQQTYPFYTLGPGEPFWPNLWRWELLYITQFFGVEFFFRGFLVHATKHRFGPYAIFPMVVPYCMLHFFKPLPETLASILGATLLGFMSLRTRSIWMGTAIHITVALTMDISSLWRQGLLW
jgi:membrane protease YdiL (CAAX protease family)